MEFGGIQKVTLLDYPDKTACTLFTIGCNFSCPYCQNSSLLKPTGNEKTQSQLEIIDFLKTRQGLLDGVCISGGEPLLQDDLDTFLKEVKELGFSVKLDTNGAYPERLEKLMKTGVVDHIAMDIKNTPEKYALTIGMHEYDVTPVEKSMDLLRKAAIPYEFRTTVVREFHTADDLLSIAKWISGAEKFYLQSFTDVDGVLQSGLHNYSETEMQGFLSRIIEILPTAELRGV